MFILIKASKQPDPRKRNLSREHFRIFMNASGPLYEAVPCVLVASSWPSCPIVSKYPDGLATRR